MKNKPKEETKPFDFKKRSKEVQDRATELSATHGVKVVPFLSYTPATGEIVGYFKEPTLDFEMKCVDLMYTGRFAESGALILENHLIKEESDKRITRENKIIYMGAVQFCMGMVEYCANLIKKN